MIKLRDLILEGENDRIQSEVESLQKNLYQKYPELQDLHIYIQSNGTLFIGSIKVKLESRRQGIGKNVIRDIKKFADDHNLIIVLSPEPERGYKKKLDRFYKDLGFIPNQGRQKNYGLSSFFGKTMYRKPGVKEDINEEIPDVFYHATFNELIPSISNKGLVPGGIDYQNFEGCESGVYLSDDYSFAGSMIEGGSENEDIPDEWFDNIVVILIDPNKLDLTKMEKDPHVNISADDEHIPRSFIYKGIIPTSAFIEIVDFSG
jgi:hypothetical protein